MLSFDDDADEKESPFFRTMESRRRRQDETRGVILKRVGFFLGKVLSFIHNPVY